jgi:hypothetical protein
VKHQSSCEIYNNARNISSLRIITFRAYSILGSVRAGYENGYEQDQEVWGRSNLTKTLQQTYIYIYIVQRDTLVFRILLKGINFFLEGISIFQPNRSVILECRHRTVTWNVLRSAEFIVKWILAAIRPYLFHSGYQTSNSVLALLTVLRCQIAHFPAFEPRKSTNSFSRLFSFITQYYLFPPFLKAYEGGWVSHNARFISTNQFFV